MSTNLIKVLKSEKKVHSCLNSFKYELHNINDGLVGFDNLIEHIIEECRNVSVFPMIHLICHGGEKIGIAMWNECKKKQEIVDWGNLYSSFSNINVACHNNLFVTLSTCHGLDSLRALFSTQNQVIPFVASIGVSPKAVLSIHDSAKIFCGFYQKLLETLSIKEAWGEILLQKSILNGDLPSFVSSDDLFIECYKNTYNSLYTEEHIRELIKCSEFEKCFPNQNIDDITKQFLLNKDKYIQQDYIRIRNRKFMLEDPLVNQDNFQLPDRI